MPISHKQANSKILLYKQDSDQRTRLNSAAMWTAGSNLVGFNMEAIF